MNPHDQRTLELILDAKLNLKKADLELEDVMRRRRQEVPFNLTAAHDAANDAAINLGALDAHLSA